MAQRALFRWSVSKLTLFPGQVYFLLQFVFECVCRLHLFVLDSNLATLWESNCPFGFLLVMFPLGSSYFVFVFLSLWSLWWEVWDNCIDSWSLPSLLCLSVKWYFVHILLLVPDMCPSCISRKRRIYIEIISWQISNKVMRPSWDSNLRPLDLQSQVLSNVLWSTEYEGESISNQPNLFRLRSTSSF